METYEHKCLQCDKVYSTSSNLYKHMRQKHFAENVAFGSSPRAKCPICNKAYISKIMMEHHIKVNHEIEVHKEIMVFTSQTEFSTWKKEVENDNKTMFVQNSGSKTYGGTKMTYYYCHRSGYYNSRGTGKRNIKIIGTNKIDANCPSMMKVTEKESKIIVEYTKTHIGHSNDTERMKLSEQERNIVAVKPVNKIPISTILDDSGDSVSDGLQPVHPLTRGDILNIKEEFNIDSCRHLNACDTVSVENWVKV